ncbi:flagellar hook-length control protein [Sporocytophaga myxococcoides]|uniref:Flagellar hook-length control protein n=1 Tax=Sporocytophaga myxococcoides TaxID=153721 RepID=A0A098LGK2_9BACT|nr:T9SS type A sorting domain-containing protein [Sporocytophaga myxococcoides]GAL86095.1 flagellar hook-length control protein [Sporocytophaga myxococcoides]
MKENLLFVAMFLLSGLLMSQPQLVSDLPDRPSHFTPFGEDEELYFAIKDQLWHSNGNPSNTHMVIDLNEIITSILTDNENIYIVTQGPSSKYYISDGTAAGTVLQPNGDDFPFPPSEDPQYVLNGFTYYISGDSLLRTSSPEATPEVFLKDDDFADNVDGMWDNNFAFVILGVLDDKLIFATSFYETATGYDVLKVYSTNGSADDTTFLQRINPGHRFSLIEYYKGKMLFIVDNHLALNYPVYITDGTAEGTIELTEPIGRDPHKVEFKEVDGEAVLIIETQSGRYFWQTDGTPENTFHFLFIESYYSEYRGVENIGSTLFYIDKTDEDDPSDLISDYGLFQMNIHDNVPFQVNKLTADPTDRYVGTYNLTNVNGVLYFATGYLNAGFFSKDLTPQLWKYSPPFLTEVVTSVIEKPDTEMAAYPNPFYDKLQVKNCDGKSITLTNALGTIVHQEKYISESVNLSHLPGGIYFVYVEGLEEIMKVVKK